jgi:hypothetical protein
MHPLRRPRLVAVLALGVLSLVTRLPALLNAAGTNSDAAVVGLQARHIVGHIFGGAWSPYLWGSGYQTSADSTWAALFFRVLGPGPLVLMLSALVLYVGLTFFAYGLLRRRLEPFPALVATLPLVFTTACVHSYALYPPRQMSLTLAFFALWALDRCFPRRPASGGSVDAGGTLALAAGGALAFLAVAADPYAAIFLPAAGLLAWRVVLSREGRPARVRVSIALGVGGIAGAVPIVMLLARPESKHGVVSMSARVVAHNAKLLWHECLPWAIGAKIYKPLHAMDYVAWKMPPAYAYVTYVGIGLLCAALVVSSVLAVLRRSRLAAIAWLTIGLNFVSFLLSRMVMDQFSMRYLAASVLVLPLALEPLVAKVGARWGAAILAPYLFVALSGGWLSHGPWVRGPLPRLVETGAAEARLLHALQDRHVDGAVADYWAAYRLDFLWREAIPVAPYHVEQDRWPPYRRAVAAAKRVAYVHDAERSFEDEKTAERELAAGGTVVDRFVSDEFSVVVVERATSPASPRSSSSAPRAP